MQKGQQHVIKGDLLYYMYMLVVSGLRTVHVHEIYVYVHVYMYLHMSKHKS